MKALARGEILTIVALSVLFFMFQSCSEKVPRPDKMGHEGRKAAEGIEEPSSEAVEKKQIESLKAVLLPGHPTVGDILTVEITGKGGMVLSPFTVRWYVNEDLIDNSDISLDLSSFMRGDRVYAQVIFDEQGYEPLVTDVLTIANAPPEITAIQSETLTDGEGTVFKVIADAIDQDRDTVTLRYRFFVNEGLAYESPGGEFDISKLKRDDRIYCAVVPVDGKSTGEETKTPTFKISNRPPKIVSKPPSRLSGDIFTYKIAGEDPDGDELLFELVEGPEGMVLMEDTLHWDVRPVREPGPVKTVVKASDGHGGDATQEFTLSIASK